MAWVYNPFTGKLDQTAASGGGGGNPFDQSLNTTDSPQFAGALITTNKLAISSTSGSYGLLQLLNPAGGECSVVQASGASGAGGTITSDYGDSYIWAFGPGAFSASGDTFVIGNAANGAQLQISSSGNLSSPGSLVLQGDVTATNIGTAASKNYPATGNATSTQVVLGSDTRLTDNRTPTAHTHSLSALTQSSATSGQVPQWNGTAWVATTPTGTTDAAALTTGTLADSRLSTNVVTLTGTQTLTNKSISSGQITGLATVATSASAADLSTGILSDSRLSTNVLLLTGSQTITGSKTITPAAGSSALVASNVTHTTSAPILDLTQTWNASAVAFSALKLSVTNTAAAAASTLLDLSVGGTSQLHVTPAKQIRLFNSRSDASNYECAVLDWTTNTNALTLGTQKAGTGTARRVRLNSAENIDFYISDSSRSFQMATNGNISFSPMTWQYYSGAGDPTTSTTPWNNGASYCALWRNTTTGVVKLWVNNNGTMVSVALS